MTRAEMQATATALGPLTFNASTGAICLANGSVVAQVNVGGPVSHVALGQLLTAAPALVREAVFADKLCDLLTPYWSEEDGGVSDTLERLLDELEVRRTRPVASTGPTTEEAAEIVAGVVRGETE